MPITPPPAAASGCPWRLRVASGVVRAGWRTSVALGLLAAGCGGPSQPHDDLGPPDTSVDAATDAGDLGPPVDLGPSGCFLNGRATLATDPTGGDIAFALAGRSAEFTVVYVDPDPSQQGVLHARLVSGEGTVGDELTIAAAAVTGRAEPSLAPTAQGWLAAWTELSAGPDSSIRGRALLADATPDPSAEGAERALADTGSRAPSLARVEDRIYLGYVAPVDGADRVQHRALDAYGAPLADPLVVSPAAHDPARVRTVAGSTGAYMTWSTTTGELHGRRVVSSSVLSGTTSPLTDPAPSPTGLFAAGFSGVVFASVWAVEDQGVRAGRLRIVRESGEPFSQVVLQPAPVTNAQPTAFALARFAAGFALVYRLASLGQHRLRVALLDSDGLRVFDAPLQSLLDGEGAVAVSSALDGSLQVAWTDRDLAGVRHLETARLTCRP